MTAPRFSFCRLWRGIRKTSATTRALPVLTSQWERGDPLNRPRLTIGGPIAAHFELKARARFLARNLKAKLYASSSIFRFFGWK